MKMAVSSQSFLIYAYFWIKLAELRPLTSYYL